MSVDPATASAVDIAARVRSREWSPVEVTEALLDRIADWEPHLNAFVDLDADGARAAGAGRGRRRRGGDQLGPLHGVPVTVKNIQDVAGPADPPRLTAHGRNARARRTRRSWRDYAPAGAIIVGTTTLPEQGWTAVGDSPLTGATHTPWRHGSHVWRVIGRCWSARRRRMRAAARRHRRRRLDPRARGVLRCRRLQADLRHRPYVPVPNNGSLSHAGPITRSVADAALMLSVIGGPDPRDHTSLPTTPRATVEPGDLRGLRIAYSPDLGHARVDPEVAAAVERSVRPERRQARASDLVTPEWGPSGPAMERDLWALAVLAYLPGGRCHRRADGSRTGRLHARLRGLQTGPGDRRPAAAHRVRPGGQHAGSAIQAGTCCSRRARR